MRLLDQMPVPVLPCHPRPLHRRRGLTLKRSQRVPQPPCTVRLKGIIHNQRTVFDVFEPPELRHPYLPALDLGPGSHLGSPGSASNRTDCSRNYHLRPPAGNFQCRLARCVSRCDILPYRCVTGECSVLSLCYPGGWGTASMMLQQPLKRRYDSHWACYPQGIGIQNNGPAIETWFSWLWYGRTNRTLPFYKGKPMFYLEKALFVRWSTWANQWSGRPEQAIGL
jgi:hypothetical protein